MNSFDQYEKLAHRLANEMVQKLPKEQRVQMEELLEKEGDDVLLSDSEELDVSPEMIHQIKDGKHFVERNEAFERVDVKAEWDRFNDRLTPRKPVVTIYRNLIRYAAVLLIPLMCAGIAYYMVQSIPDGKDTIEQVARIEPGGPKAQLILGNGKKVDLENENISKLKESDGTQINKKAGKLSYEAKNQLAEFVRPVYNTVNIPRGGEYQLQLADGTKVYLNSMSSLKFPVQFTGEKREVELSGEAYFEVTKDASHPFVVNLNGMKVEVLGTSFNVKAYKEEEQIVTTLVEGKVKVKGAMHTRDDVILLPNQQAVLNHQNGRIDVSKVDVFLYTAWKDGKLVFKDERLEDIMNALARWYNVEVFYMNQEVKDIRFSANLNKYGDIIPYLEILETTDKVEVKIKGNTVVFNAK